MKIALVRQNYTPFGGAERFVERALDGLRAQGVDVTVIARKWAGETAAGFLQCDPFYLGRSWRDASFAGAVQQIIASKQFDLVQSHERIPGCHIYRAGDGVHATWLELRNAARGKLSTLTTALSYWHRRTLVAEAAMFRHADLKAVICNSAMVRADIARRFGVGADRLHVIHNGVDLEHFHPGLRAEHCQSMRSQLGIAERAPVILFVGSGFERKGVFILLQALVAMQQREAQLVVVGKDRDAAICEKLAQTLGIDERIRFVGGQEDVRPYYGMADVFCLPTLYDPMPNAALEAFACGLPVVTTRTSGAAELVDGNRNGQVVEALDAPALARSLDNLCLSCRDQGVKDVARATVAGMDVSSMTERLTDLYRRLGGR